LSGAEITPAKYSKILLPIKHLNRVKSVAGHAQSEPEIISLNNGTTIVEFHNDSSHSKKAYVCYKKMLGGNSIDVISLRESAEAQYELPITQG